MHKRGVIGVGVVALTLWLGTTPAMGGQGRHCAYRLEQSGVVGPHEAREAAPVLLGCFAMFRDALAIGSGGAIRVSAATTPGSLANAQLPGSSQDSLTSVLIGTEYDGTGYTGSSNSYFASTTCSASVTWELNWVGDTWNDRFESGKGFGGCDHNKKYHDADYVGAVLTCAPNCNDYGGLANQVSSLRWKP